MKKSFIFLTALMLMLIAGNTLIQAQSNTQSRQVIIANGGKFETTPPFSDYVTVEAYNLATKAVTVFGTIYTQSVQDVLISGNKAYVTAQDSVVLYNIDTFTRIAAVADSGVNQMALVNGKLIVTKQYPVGRFRVEALSATDLSLVALIDGIPGDCEGVAVYNNRAFVACDSGYAGTQGRLCVINTANWSLDTILNFGTPAIGIYSVYAYGGYIYTVNKTPYGGGNLGSITRLNPNNGSFVTNTLALNIGSGYGIMGNLLYLGINKSIGSYNLNTQAVVDTALVSYFGIANNIAINSCAVDTVENQFYTNIGNRTSLGAGIVFSLTGDSLGTYHTGLNADACAIDFRLPTGIANNTGSVQESLSIYPNPVSDYLGINLGSISSPDYIKILDLTGRTLEYRTVQPGEDYIRINVADYPAGIYLISYTSEQGTKVKKFIKR